MTASPESATSPSAGTAVVLVVDGAEVAPASLAKTARARAKGLLGQHRAAGATILSPANAVHTLGMRFAIDVAFVDADRLVLDTVTMQPWRLGRPRRRCCAVIEANAGDFAQWGLAAGSRVSWGSGVS